MAARLRTVLVMAAVLVTALPAPAQAGGSAGTATAGSSTAPDNWRTVLTVPAGQQLAGLAIDLRRAVGLTKWAYTADTTTGRIVKFGTGGKRLLSWTYGKPMSSGGPVGLAVGGNGNVFVADPGAGTVTRFSPSGRLLARWTGFSLPTGVAVDRAGHVFVAEQDARRVTELSPEGTVVMRWSPIQIYPPGGASAPTGVVIGPPNEIYLSTSCGVGVTCGPGVPTGTARSQLLDGLLEFYVSGLQRGHPMEMWFGLVHTPTSPLQPPDKESEPFAGIGAIGSDPQGWLYVAGTVWWRGSTPRKGILAYTPFGYKWDTLYLPTQTTPSGVAAGGNGIVYVAQGNRILAASLGKRPSSPTG